LNDHKKLRADQRLGKKRSPKKKDSHPTKKHEETKINICELQPSENRVIIIRKQRQRNPVRDRTEGLTSWSSESRKESTKKERHDQVPFEKAKGTGREPEQKKKRGKVLEKGSPAETKAERTKRTSQRKSSGKKNCQRKQ